MAWSDETIVHELIRDQRMTNSLRMWSEVIEYDREKWSVIKRDATRLCADIALSIIIRTEAE